MWTVRRYERSDLGYSLGVPGTGRAYAPIIRSVVFKRLEIKRMAPHIPGIRQKDVAKLSIIGYLYCKSLGVTVVNPCKFLIDYSCSAVARSFQCDW